MDENYKFSNVVFIQPKIYSLADNNGNIFYIGMTICPLAKRVAEHISEAKRNHKWNRSVKNERIRELSYDLTATIVHMEFVAGSDQYHALQRARKSLERKWILKFIDLGYKLTNREAKPKIKKVIIPQIEYVGQVYKSGISKDDKICVTAIEHKNSETATA